MKEYKLNSWGLHWFRRDLRVAGNPALRENFKKHNGKILGLFVIDRKFLSRDDFSYNRFQFFLETLLVLKSDLNKLGGELLVLDEGPDAAFSEIFAICRDHRIQMPAAISWNRDYEPFARARDERVKKHVEEMGVQTLTCRDHLLIEPHELLKSDGTYYQVYTPFARRWFDMLNTAEIQNRIAAQANGIKLLESTKNSKASSLFACQWSDVFGANVPEDRLTELMDENIKHVTVKIPEAGALVAFKRAKLWAQKIKHYADERDIPSIDGTSKMSIYLKNGSLTTAQVIAILKLTNLPFKSENSETKYLKELVWREFYYHLLWHEPRLENEAFQKKYQNIVWDNDKKMFEAWKRGMTGYPIVDAGMRQLISEGWMHNRVRMIVASFLTKDLLIDWRWGEKWFMEKLLDGDLAPNNGGWQWAASAGCDAQPYFRIFNPESQSIKFDPDGQYIKKYIPELRSVSAKEIHCPSQASRTKSGYPDPVVDHGQRRIAALMRYKA